MKKLIFILVLLVVATACSPSPSPSAPRATSAPDPYTSFRTVRNDCGVCGTDSPVGGWEAEDGRSLILSEDGSYTAFFSDGSTMSGEWELTGSQLCLNTAGAESCFSYQQKVDAMKLDDAIYIRE